MERLTILINGRFLDQRLSGVQRYAAEIVLALDRLIGSDGAFGDCDWALVTTGRAERRLALRHIDEIRRPGVLPGHLWEQTSLRRIVGDRPLLNLAGSGPLLAPRQLTVIHDAAVFRHPEHFSRAYGAFHRCVGRVMARRARIATVSDFSRGELAAVAGAPYERILVARNGAEHLARIAPDRSVVARLGLAGRPFFLMIGNLARNKNVATAMRAVEMLDGRAALVVVGGGDPKVFEGGELPPSAGTRFVGRRSDAEVAGLLQAAEALLFPSLYEGFGIPPLEAMVNGCPVIASAIAAVVEVCGETARYFPPKDAAALAALMREALDEDAATRAARVHHGRRRADSYRWEDSARLLAEACIAMIPSVRGGPVRRLENGYAGLERVRP